MFSHRVKVSFLIKEYLRCVILNDTPLLKHHHTVEGEMYHVPCHFLGIAYGSYLHLKLDPSVTKFKQEILSTN